VAPAWKLNSLLTKFRAALNFEKMSKKSGLSLNDISVGGSAPLDMAKTARFLKSKKGLAVADVSKFFQQIFISKSSYPLQLLVWRKNGDPKEPLTYWSIPRLTYGHKSASTLAKILLEVITEYGEERCTFCNGNFSITNPERSTIKSGHGMSHSFAYCCQYN
jgi:hypothetical protein